MALSSPGIGSNLPINDIITQLMQAESRPLTVLAKKESSYQSRLSAYGALSGALSSFQSTVAGLSNMSKFQQLSTTSSDKDVASATTTDKAVPGQYKLDVTQLAQAQSLSAAGQASTTAAIGGGGATTLTFQFGTIAGELVDGKYQAGASFQQNPDLPGGAVTIDSSNNSLQGIRDAINKADMGVTATIVNDGSATPHRLVLTSNKTGEASSMRISVEGDAAVKDLLTYQPDGAGSSVGIQNLTQSSRAQDALMLANGIEIRNATNTFANAIEGVNLTVAKTGETTIGITRDTASVESAINGFIKAYNELHGTLKYQTGYNAETKTGGPLVGDSTARSIQTSLRNMFAEQPQGLDGALVNLSQIGVSFQKDGTLAVDSSKLKDAMVKNTPADIGKLFATAGTATDSLVSMTGSTKATKPGSYEVVVTSLATKGFAIGSNDLAASTVITAGSNDELSLTVDGVSASLKLAAGTYTPASLIAHLQSTINGASAFSAAGVSVSVAQDGNKLTITSNRYGSASKVEINASSAAAALGNLSSSTATTGKDVTGTIGGMAATGNGQFLTGADGSDAEGLKLQILGGSLGARGTVSFSHGYATQLDQLLGSFLGKDGMIAGRTDGINRSIKDLGSQREVLNRRLADTEERYRKQFTALDALISSMNSTSSFLSQQLANLANLNNQ